MLSYDEIEAFREDNWDEQDASSERRERDAPTMRAGLEMLSLFPRMQASVLQGMLTARF